MVRISKKQKNKKCPKKCKYPQDKTGPLKDNLPKGYKPHKNAVNSKTMYVKTFKY